MKPIYPTLKEKKRYLLVKVISDNSIIFSDIQKEITKQVKEFIGEIELSKAGLIFFNESWDSNSKTFILRVGIKQVDKFKGAITLIKTIKTKPVVLSTLKTSGKLNKLKNFQKGELNG